MATIQKDEVCHSYEGETVRKYTTKEESQALINLGLDMSDAVLCIKDGEISINKNEEGTVPVYTFTELYNAIPDTFILKTKGKKIRKNLEYNGISFLYDEPEDEVERKYPIMLHNSIKSDNITGTYLMLSFVLSYCEKC